MAVVALPHDHLRPGIFLTPGMLPGPTDPNSILEFPMYDATILPANNVAMVVPPNVVLTIPGATPSNIPVGVYQATALVGGSALSLTIRVSIGQDTTEPVGQYVKIVLQTPPDNDTPIHGHHHHGHHHKHDDGGEHVSLASSHGIGEGI